MFNINLKVADTRLADTITKLREIGFPSVAVEKLEGSQGAAIGQPSDLSKSNGSLVTKTRVKSPSRRSYTRRYVHGGPSFTDQAIALLTQYGDKQSFTSGEFVAKCRNVGISAPVAYRALRLAQDSGSLSRTEPGTYQRQEAKSA